MGSQQYSLRWNNYLRHITCAFESLRTDKDLVDVTLSCDGHKVHAHKMLLSACSSYFRDLFKENPCQHPVIIFRNVRFDDLMALIDFMYQGEVNVEQEQLASFLNTAELLQVQGLTHTNNSADDTSTKEDEDVPAPEVQFGDNASPRYQSTNSPNHAHPSSSSSAPATKKRRWRARSTSPVSVTPILTGTDCPPEQQLRNSSPPIEILPMKMEAPDFIEEETDLGNETDETLARLRDNEELLLTKSSSSSMDTHMFSNPADVHPVLETGDDNLILPGPSNEHAGPSQDNLQGLPCFRTKDRHSSASIKNLILRGENNAYVCKLCGRYFKDRKSCQRHMSMHLGTSTCPICFNVLSRVSHLKRHMKNVHGFYLKNENQQI